MTRKQEAPEITQEVAKVKPLYEVRAEFEGKKLTMFYTTRNSALATRTQLVASGWTVKVFITKEIV